MASASDPLATAWQAVRNRISSAALRAGRDPATIELVAVSKKQPTAAIERLRGLGQVAFGENYAQALRDRARDLAHAATPGSGPRPGREIAWHFLGALQRNKIKYVVGTASLIHSVDRLELAVDIEQRAAHLGLTQDILLEVNVAREPQKGGVLPEALAPLLAEVATLPHLRVRGLMTMGALTNDPEASRPTFRSLALLARQHSGLGLSMGMSQDFEVAIEEGATWIRVGTAIFGARR